MSGTCSHEFSPAYPDFPSYKHIGSDNKKRSRWLLSDDVPGVEDGTWSCPHDAVSGFDKCPFHLSASERPSELSVTAEFLRRLSEAQNLETRHDRRRKVQFIDAEFDDFDVAGEVLDTGAAHYINLAHATINNINLTNTRIRPPIRFSHVTFEGESQFQNATFDGFVEMRNATFSDPIRLKGAVFNRPLSARHSTFIDDAYFWHTIFKQYADFRDTEFQGYAYFRGIDFERYVRFSQAHFHNKAVFKLGEFGDDADFIDTRFDKAHSFTNAEFRRTTDFSGVRTSGPMDLSGAELQRLEIEPEEIDSDTQYIDLSDSVVKAGELGQPKEGRVLYDAERATLGDVAVTTPNDDSVVENVRLVSTNFDGFEFESDDMSPEATGWEIHSVFDESLLPEGRSKPLSSKTLRETYLKAKNGAKQVGNNVAAGHFYYKEMVYRRKYTAELAQSGEANRARTTVDWVRNSALWIVTGYGEYPLRVVGSSIGVILGFAGIYQLYATDDTSIIESILFSAQSFITFIVGSPPQEATQIVATVSILQGFIGAFFIALFVYAFTRRLNR